MPENPYESDKWVCFDVADDWYKPVNADAPHFTGSELAAAHGAWEEGRVVRNTEKTKHLTLVIGDLNDMIVRQKEVVDKLVEVLTIVECLNVIRDDGESAILRVVRAAIAKAKG